MPLKHPAATRSTMDVCPLLAQPIRRRSALLLALLPSATALAAGTTAAGVPVSAEAEPFVRRAYEFLEAIDRGDDATALAMWPITGPGPMAAQIEEGKRFAMAKRRRRGRLSNHRTVRIDARGPRYIVAIESDAETPVTVNGVQMLSSHTWVAVRRSEDGRLTIDQMETSW